MNIIYDIIMLESREESTKWIRPDETYERGVWVAAADRMNEHSRFHARGTGQTAAARERKKKLG